MSFQPVLAGGGLGGWQFLKATQTNQRAAFDTSPLMSRDTDHFSKKIANIRTAEALAEDRRLLRVALGAFGLQDDLNNTFFIRKILEEGTTDPEALANKLADERYRAFSKAFAFDSPIGPRTARTGFSDDIVKRYRAQQFEIAVGAQDETLRLALNFERALPEIAAAPSGPDAKWFRLMGTPPLRTVLETALGLPKGFGQIDIDKQLEMFRDKAQARFGVRDLDAMQEEGVMRRIIQSYLLQTQSAQFARNGTARIALDLLQAIPRRSFTG